MNILLVEDEVSLSEGLVHYLKKNKYNVDAVYDGEDGYENGLSNRYDCIVLDIMLPKMNGFEVLRKLREEKVTTPVLVLSALGETSNKIKGLDLGADDYLAKPFEPEELLARIKALLRRKTDVINEDVITFGDIVYNASSYEIICKKKKIKISLKESEIMAYLLARPNFVVSKDELIIKIWGYDSEAEYNNIEVYISFLRKKLAFLGSKVMIATVRGAGYKLEV
ncbi:MAG: response regulator transcription factor [Clostridia bacterium]